VNREPRTVLNRELFKSDPLTCARAMIGCELVWGKTAGLIVETEAYAEFGDQASHAFFRKGTRTFIETKAPGTLYVYLNYGVHWLLNFLVKGSAGNGFVLVRALEPTVGLHLMRKRRKIEPAQNLCSGPGKLTQALGITGEIHGRDFFDLKTVMLLPACRPVTVEIDRRIGITRSTELDWRFLMVESRFVSSQKKTRLRAN
jgi:DNA-3-methyladenine glycosylase